MNYLLLLLVIPVAAIILILFKFPPKPVALAASLLNFSFSLGLLYLFQADAAGYQFVLDIPWVTLQGLLEIRFHLGVDGISLPLILLSTIVTVAAVAVSPDTIRRPAEFFTYILLISLGAIGAFASLDLFFLYIFHEFALIPTFLLIGIWGGQARRFAATQLTLYLALGSLVLLAGVVALVIYSPVPVRTFDLPTIQAHVARIPLTPSTQVTIFPFFLIGFGVLISLFPFHSWAPQGYASAPPAAAMLHAGVLKKFGLYGLLRVAMPLLPLGLTTPVHFSLAFIDFTFTWGTVLQVLLVGNILYVGMVALAQKELQLMLGFSSVMHMGYLFLALVAWNQVSLAGFVLLMVGHGLSAALLFGLAGEIRERTGETRFSALGGLAQRAPVLAVLFLIASMASIGLPGLANFSGEILVFFGAWKTYPVLTICALWGVVISSVYQLRAVRNTLYGDLPEKFAGIQDLTGFMQRAPYVLLVVALLLLGFFPGILLRIIQPAVRALLGA